jgi:hypothetical protein
MHARELGPRWNIEKVRTFCPHVSSWSEFH